jgi:hypothetical protein
MAARTSTAQEAASAMGRNAATPLALAGEVRRRVRQGQTHVCLDLLGVHAALTSSNGLLDYLRREVVGNPLRSLFFVQAPLDRAIVTVPLQDLAPLVTLAVDMGADVPRLACGAATLLVRAAGEVDDVPTLCNAVCCLAAVARDLVAEEELFVKLAARMRPTANVCEVVRVVEACGVYDGRIAAIVLRCARMLVGEFTRVHRLVQEPHMHAALACVTRCATHTYWRPILVPHVVQMARHGWPDDFAPLLRAMLADPSVELLLALEATHRLAHLVRRVHDGGEPWKEVTALLRKQWPAKVAEVLNVVPERKVAKEHHPTCAITLDACVHPVVASDGHTYERDALLEHMRRNGRLSPLTKETLHYELYENRAVM